MRTPLPTWFFVLVAVRLEDRLLLVHERKHGQLWYLPAGRVEAGESLLHAAERETLEETGVPIEVTGFLRLEHEPHPDGGVRCRVFFVGRPRGNPQPKLVPDEESLGAAWVRLRELSQYPLRSEEVRSVFEYLARGGAVYPLSLLTREGAAWR
jgi:phosphatase NudJ